MKFMIIFTMLFVGFSAQAGLSEVVSDQFTTIIMALLAVSELLALIPALKANSIFQLIVGILKKLAGGE